MAEDKIDITVNSRWYSNEKVDEIAVTFGSLMAALNQVYRQATDIGWETKSLNALSEWIDDAYQQANKASQ